ncbi:MAG TPA: hypothetical protein VGN77_02095, partial [Steroidobacteraceae bacterium]|nr:hypothetical protein [Steroidobacteraceae bacterium]
QSELAGLDAIWSSQGGAFFRAGPFDDYMVLHNATTASDQEVYAQRARALIASWGLARLPEWYRHGIVLLMSAARFEPDRLVIGQDAPDRSARLAHGWIPMAQFLQLPPSDPMLHRSPDIEALYEAQCWWLVHLSLLDGVLDKVMPLYLQRLLIGESQVAAYAATFGMPYDQLDQYFKKVKHNIKLREFTSTLPDAATLGSPQQLTDPQAKARLAEVLLVHEPQSASGAQMASDVLAAEPNNARAMLALARHELAARRYVQVQESLQQLGALEELPAASHVDLGVLLSTLARLKEENMPGTNGVDTKATRTAAREHFKRAMILAPNDPRAAYQLGWLLCGQGDVAGTRELLPKVEAAFYRRPESADFAELLVRMHSIAGNTAEVFKYAVAEQRLAATETERARASARVERLRAQLNAPQ